MGEADVCESVSGGHVEGGVVGGSGGAVGESAGDATVVNAVRGGEGGEGGLEGVGVGFEPGEEGRFAKDPGVGELGGVDVGVCEEDEKELASFLMFLKTLNV